MNPGRAWLSRLAQFWIDAIVESYGRNRAGQNAILAVIFLTTVAYCAFNDLMLGRAQSRVAYEGATLAAVLILLLPAIRRYLSSRSDDRTQFLSFAFLACATTAFGAIVLGTAFYVSATYRLNSNMIALADAKAEIETLRGRPVIVTAEIGSTATFYSGALSIKINRIRQKADRNSVSVDATISSPTSQPISVIVDAGSASGEVATGIEYAGGAFAIYVVSANDFSASFQVEKRIT